MTQAPQAGPARPGRPWPAAALPLRSALGLFTILPVRAVPEIGRPDAARAVLWLPVAGLLLSVPAAGVLLGVQAGGGSAPRRLLAAALAIGVLALLTGGLHLDGLADTADGLGSRRPRDEALAIMRRSDVGPFGVVALLFTVLVQVTALATVTAGWPGVAALAVAAVTGRTAVVLATGPGSPAATAARAVIAVLAGLCAAGLLRRLAVRRLGGMTGDVFGALVEVSSAMVLLALALTA